MKQLTPEQALAAAAALYPKVAALQEVLNQQVRLLPPGNDDWVRTREKLEIHRGALLVLQNIGAGQ